MITTLKGRHAPAEFTGSAGRTLPDYRIVRDGLTLLAMALTGKKALAFKLAYIDAFQRMEAIRSRLPAFGSWS
ncbi:Rha family transcriptional regulator [Comamonas thiooxydans]|uniref:Rha family transcriptional regulator n=1 Tax=Comamonas thiooxydans TaxID=363952 RepID=UPI0009B9292D|nr:Rha family transcriptional regulator [Comamonas thiooxydans]